MHIINNIASLLYTGLIKAVSILTAFLYHTGYFWFMTWFMSWTQQCAAWVLQFILMHNCAETCIRVTASGLRYMRRLVKATYSHVTQVTLQHRSLRICLALDRHIVAVRGNPMPPALNDHAKGCWMGIKWRDDQMLKQQKEMDENSNYCNMFKNL